LRACRPRAGGAGKGRAGPAWRRRGVATTRGLRREEGGARRPQPRAPRAPARREALPGRPTPHPGASGPASSPRPARPPALLVRRGAPRPARRRSSSLVLQPGHTTGDVARDAVRSIVTTEDRSRVDPPDQETIVGRTHAVPAEAVGPPLAGKRRRRRTAIADGRVWGAREAEVCDAPAESSRHCRRVEEHRVAHDA